MAAAVECAVIGAGVVGLAVARAIARRGREVLLLEAANLVGSGTSSRNSEVIHAGIYYAKGSLKARTCVRGRELLYEYCREHHVPHKQCGKLIVATSAEQVEQLEALKGRGEGNGVHNLRLISKAEVADLEPEVQCHTALHSPSTGIVDSHGLMLALHGDFEDAGGLLALNAPVERGTMCPDGSGLRISVGGEEPMQLTCSMLVNSAGLHAPTVARSFLNMPPEVVPKPYFAKGNYYNLQGRRPFSRLVYPVPEQAGLGVHATLDLQGQVRFGPDVEWVLDDSDYDVDPNRAQVFYEQVRKYWPALPDGALVPDYSGIRPKIQAPGAPPADFLVAGPAEHGIPGLVHLFGVESPGLTASLAIAEHLEAILLGGEG